jgi:hypothetical protein
MSIPTIVQSAGYVFPSGVTGPASIPLSADPTPGNLLVAGLPLDYAAEGFSVNPYWTLFLTQDDGTLNFPMTWFYHNVVSGDTADLPVFYDGLVYPYFSGFIGGCVWELENATATPNGSENGWAYSYTGFNPPGQDTLSLSDLPVTAGNIALLMVVASVHPIGYPPPPPWVTISVGSFIEDASGSPIVGDEDENVYSYYAGHNSSITAPTFVLASFSPQSGNCMISGVGISYRQNADQIVVAPVTSTSLPCVPCCTTVANIPI